MAFKDKPLSVSIANGYWSPTVWTHLRLMIPPIARTHSFRGWNKIVHEVRVPLNDPPFARTHSFCE